MKKWKRKIKKLKESLQEVNRLLDKAVEEGGFEEMWNETKKVLTDNWGEHYVELDQEHDCLNENEDGTI